MKFLVEVCHEGSRSYVWNMNVEDSEGNIIPDFRFNSMNPYLTVEDAFANASRFAYSLFDQFWVIDDDRDDSDDSYQFTPYSVLLSDYKDYGWSGQFIMNGPICVEVGTKFFENEAKLREVIKNIIDCEETELIVKLVQDD